MATTIDRDSHGDLPSRKGQAASLPLAYPQARRYIHNGDVLLWRPSSLLGRLICLGTRARYSHASLAGWWGDVLLNIEMVQWQGGQIVRLSQQVARWPGLCDVFRPQRQYSGRGAVERMVKLVGQRYGWADFWHLFVRRYSPIPHAALPNSDDPDQPRVCSAAVAWALRTGGCLSAARRRKIVDSETTPGGLLRWPWLKYVCTLLPDPEGDVGCELKPDGKC